MSSVYELAACSYWQVVCVEGEEICRHPYEPWTIYPAAVVQTITAY